MCEPATLTMIAIGMTAAGAVAQGVAAERRGDFQEKVANYNAKVDEQKAQQAIELGAQEEAQHRQRVRQVQASQRAAMAGSGAVVGEGTFGNILDDTAKAGEFDALQIRSNAARQAWAYRTNADITRSEGKMAASAGRWALGTSLLTGASQSFGMASQIKK